MHRTPALAVLLAAVASSFACAIGYDRALFATKSNIGIDVDSTPPTAEISIARREGVLEPGFEGGQTPPVIASFAVQNNPFSAFFFGVSARFAGGDAAQTLPLTGDATNEAPLCVSQEPVGRLLGREIHLPKAGELKPFFFATDTSFGLKVAWSGTAGQFPDTVKLGYNRKEYALAPVFGAVHAGCTDPSTPYGVKMPSFLAAIDVGVRLGTPADAGVRHIQHFATGAAATKRASQADVKDFMVRDLDRAMDRSTGTWDDSVRAACLREWIAADDANLAEVNRWWAGRGHGRRGSAEIGMEENADEREVFIAEQKIDCPAE